MTTPDRAPKKRDLHQSSRPPLHDLEIASDDRISKLPLEWKLQLLNRLSQEDAYKTSGLSKTWKHVWCLLPDLLLVMDIRKIRSPEKFKAFVDRVLATREESKIPLEKFHLELDTNLREQVFGWFEKCISLGVQTIHLSLQNKLLFQTFDWGIFQDARTLVELVLDGDIVLSVPGNNDLIFPHIRKIKLSSIFYENENSLPNLVSGCPELQDLNVLRDREERNDQVALFTIESNSLRFLKIIFQMYRGKYRLVIKAPKLERVHLHDMISNTILMERCYLASEAYIETSWYCPIDVMGCLQSISSLQLGWRSLLHLNGTINKPENLELKNRGLPLFSRLTMFSLGICHWQLLNFLLHSMPLLQKLKFETELECAGGKDSVWDPQWPVPPCMSNTLKEVEISLGISDTGLPLLQFILLYSNHLAKVCITRGIRLFDVDENTIMELPRASAECQFEFLGN